MVLDAWAASPARFREDANAEEALAVGGYAGRVLIELAANAADAARELGVATRIRIRLDGDELRVANTGKPLTADGVAALSSLRASAKRDTHDSVGHFGVGFTAVLSWTRAPRVVSRTGGIRFDAADTVTAVASLGNAGLDREVNVRGGQVPVLRLPWPADPEEQPPAGYATEVRLPLAPGIRAELDRVLVDPRTAEDLFWAIYRGASGELTEIDLPGGVVRCDTDAAGIVIIDDGVAARRYRTAGSAGRIPAELLLDRPVEERDRARWRITWALPVATGDGPDPFASSVPAAEWGQPPAAELAATNTIGAPTPTDEPLTLPARLIATFPVDDTRRRLAAGPLTDHLLELAADAYVALIAGTAPNDRWMLLPVNGFPAGPIDGALRASIRSRVERTRLLVTAVGDPVIPGEACLLPGLGAEGAALIGQAVPGLLLPVGAAAAAALRGVGVATISWSQASSALAGIERDPPFWWQVYEAASTAERPPVPEDLADIPIPLTNGRRSIGARGVLLPAPVALQDAVGADGFARSGPARDLGDRTVSGDRISAELAQRVGAVVPQMRIIDPQAAHPLLERLGARPADPDTLLADPGLNAVIDGMRRELEDTDPDPDELRDLAMLVLDLVAAGGRAGRALAVDGGRPAVPLGLTGRALLSELVLTDDDGQPWPATELLVPGAELATVLFADADRPVVGREWVQRYPTEVLVAAGVRSGFAVVQVTDPDDEELDLPDLDEWLEHRRSGNDDQATDLEPFAALADLDLVDPDRWAAALGFIAADRDARGCLTSPRPGASYTGWWLSRHALIAGRAPAGWRLPGADELADLYDVLPIDLDPLFARAIGVRADLAGAAADDPEDLLERLADPARRLSPGRVAPITEAVVQALADRNDIDLPSGVRTVTGEVLDAADALVLDQPWLVQVMAASRLVPGGADPALVGRVLDLPSASSLARATVMPDDTPPGDTLPDDTLADRLNRAAAAVGLRLPEWHIVTRAPLRVLVDGAEEPMTVRWWADQDQLWTDGSAEGVGRAVAWAAGRWRLRHRAIAAAAEDWPGLAEDGLG